MDLRELRLFVAVVEEGSIHGGARRLMITQPAVSQALRKLERELGGALVIRTSTGIELTQAGVALLDHGRDILSRMDSASRIVRDVARSNSQLLRIGLMSGIASAGDLTFPILSAFRERYPDVRLSVSDLSFANQFDALIDGRVDVAIIRPPCDDERLEVIDLFSEPTVLCFSAEHRLAAAEAVALDDVLAEPMIELVRAPGRWRAFWGLDDLRGGPSRWNRPEPAVTLSELQYALLCGPVVAAASGSAWRYGLCSPLLRTIPIVGAPPNPVAVAFVRRPPRAWAREFARCARGISEQLLDLVPGGQLIGR